MTATCPPSYVVANVRADGAYVCARNHENDPRETWPDDVVRGRIACGPGQIAFASSLTTVDCRRS